MRFLLCLCVFVIGCTKNPDELVIGTEPSFPPFESKNERGEYVGFDMDMARELAKDLGKTLVIKPMEFPSLPTALETGKIDIIISGMTATEERAKSMTFTKPYFLTGLCLLVNAKSGITGKADADGKKFVVKRGTTGDINVKRLFPNAKVTRLETEADCALEVVNGRADAFIYDQLSIVKHNEANPKTTRALLTPLTKEPYAMAVRLNDKARVNRLNKFLDDIRADGRYEKMRKKHLAGLPDGAR